MHIEIISGSPRKNSISIRIAKYLQQYISQQYSNYTVGLIDTRDWNLFDYDNVFNNVETAPEHLQPLVSRMLQANAFIIVTPEYNGTYTSNVKMLFDHFPKQLHKAFGICTSSTGPLGGARATQSLLLFIAALFGVASPQMLIVPAMDKKFDEQNQLIDAGFEKNIQQFVTELFWLAERLNK
jgi:NAD(P)H-dependent FMN reductase